MTSYIQGFLLKNTQKLQYIVNEKLAKRPGAIGNFFKWMEIGPRNYGSHIIPKYFRFWNTYSLNIGFRFNHARPALTKYATREREFVITGYALCFLLWAWLNRKNRVKPVLRYRDYHLHYYDNPARFTKKYGMYVPFSASNYKQSAHYLEISKIYFQEMMKKFIPIYADIFQEFQLSNEKVRRTKYLMNPNYVYEPFGWEAQANK